MNIETIKAPWQTLGRGARLIDHPLDIMLDVDDVFFPLIEGIHEVAYQRGIHDNTEPMRTWTGWEQYQIEPEAYWDLWTEFANDGGYLNTLPVVGAIEDARRLYWAGHRLHFVTARGFLAHAEKIREWTPQWFDEFAVPYHTLTFSQDKVAAQDHLGVRFAYAIDDSPKNFSALLSDGVSVYLQDHTHNHNFVTDRRVQTVGEFVDIILEENK